MALADGLLGYRLARARRRSLAIYVGPEGVLAKAPLSMPLAEIESFLREKTRWLRRRLQEAARAPRPFVWKQGARLPLLGVDVAVFAVAAPDVTYAPGRLEVGLKSVDDLAELRARTLAWIKNEALNLFRQRVEHYATALGVRVRQISLSNARSQWGLCHEDGHVKLAWRLYHAPPDLVDYVIAHEVSHLVEMNHSPRFWAVVHSIYPGWKLARRALRDLGRRMPDITENRP